MASNKQRQKLNHKLRRILREIGGSTIEIENDPLGSRYQVNKFGLDIEGETAVINDVYQRFLAMAVVYGYTLTHERSLTVLSKEGNEATASVNMPFALFTDNSYSRIHIGIH